ncbi:MAG: MerR family DNA-binding transcriptional regulator [Syntrophales bacterium]|nr:MerR family DNA-binding transcriptional regulator [Syntrophales bacterium]
MITINGKSYKTMADAAKHFGVSAKTVRDYIKRGIIPEPPEVRQGLRVIRYFSEDYLKKAAAEIENHASSANKVK